MDELNKALRVAFADTFFMYFKAQACHWNVEGMLFSQYHDFFGKLYEEVYSAVDPMAEQIRAMGFYAPSNLPELYSDKSVQEQNNYADGASSTAKIQDMLSNLAIVNSGVIASLNEVFRLALDLNQQGLADFIAGRIDAHKKHAWMINSSMKA